MSDPTTSTIAKCLGCGRVVFAVVDEPELIKECADDIMQLVTEGHAIEHVPHQYVRDNFGCNCPKWTQSDLLEAVAA